MELPKRFWDKVDVRGKNECWNWLACRNRDGYGKASFMGKPQKSHRIVAMSVGMDIENKVVRHKCDNPACVNPSHLEVGTHADNMKDRDSRGRGRWIGKPGASNSRAKLNEDTVRQLRSEYRKLHRYPSGRLRNGEMKKLTDKFDVPRGTARNIVEGYQWKGI